MRSAPCFDKGELDPCADCRALVLHREVKPVLRIRLPLIAFFAGVSVLSFWASMTW